MHIRAGSLYDTFQGYLPGFVPRDRIPRDTLGMGHTTPIATSVRKTRQISMLCADVWMTLTWMTLACFHRRVLRLPQGIVEEQKVYRNFKLLYKIFRRLIFYCWSMENTLLFFFLKEIIYNLGLISGFSLFSRNTFPGNFQWHKVSDGGSVLRLTSSSMW